MTVVVHASRLATLVISTLLLLGTAAGVIGCGSTRPTSTTLYRSTGGTAAPIPGGTTFPETNVSTGTTVPGTTVDQGQIHALTYLGPVSLDTWRALREIAIGAGDDGQKVLDDAAELAVGQPVEVGIAEFDAVTGIGYAAGANTSQPVGVAVDENGTEVIVFVFSVVGNPDATTIVGFKRQTGLVDLVEGPLPISNSTGNMTTIPETKEQR